MVNIIIIRIIVYRQFLTVMMSLIIVRGLLLHAAAFVQLKLVARVKIIKQKPRSHYTLPSFVFHFLLLTMQAANFGDSMIWLPWLCHTFL